MVGRQGVEVGGAGHGVVVRTGHGVVVGGGEVGVEVVEEVDSVEVDDVLPPGWWR